MPSLADVKRAGVIEALGITTASAFNKSLSDLEWDFFSTSSGLTPKEKYSLADHKFAYYKANLPANPSIIPRSLRDAEKAYYESQGAVGKSHGDLEFDLFSRLGLELNFKALGNLELYLDARKVSGQTLVSDSFNRADGPLGVADTGQAWTALTGSWGISGGKAIATQNIIESTIAINVGSSDQEISALVKNVSFSGLLLRVTDNLNYLMVRTDPGAQALQVYRKIAGDLTFRAGTSITLNAGDNYNIRCVLKSNLLNVFLNNVQVITDLSIADVPLGLLAGFRVPAGQALVPEFDDFVVKVPTLADGDTAQIWPDLSGNNRHAVQPDVAKRPLFRKESRNLLSYNQATVETDTSGFTAVSCTLSSSIVSPQHGTRSLEMSAAGSSAMSAITTNISISPGLSYSAMATVHETVDSGTSFHIVLIWYDSNNAFISMSEGNIFALAESPATYFVANAVAPGNAAFVRLGLASRYVGLNAGAKIYADKLMVAQTSSLSATDWVPPVQLPNNKPVLQFDGANDSIGTLPFTHPSEATIYSVFRVSSPVTSQQRWWTHRSTNGFWGQLDSTPTISSSARNPDGTFPSTTFIGNANNIVIHSALFKNYENNVSVINGLINGAVSGSWVHEVSTPPFEIGGYVGTLHSPLELVTILYYSKKHDDATRKRIEKALGRIAGVAIAA